MDIYLPAGLRQGEVRPAVVVVHGGGWGHRRRREAVYIQACTKLAESGYVAACIEYEIADRSKLGVNYLRNMAGAFPQNVQDVKSAVRFLRKNAAAYHIDGQHIALMGASAGGHLAALAAVTQPKDGLEPDDGHGDVSSAVQACIVYYGVFDFTTWGFKPATATDEDRAAAKRASPLQYVDKSDPPMLLLHGTKDRTVPYSQSEKMAARLKELGVAHELITMQGKDHGMFYRPDRSGLDDHAAVVKFLGHHLR